jgi:lipopolysaccharide assembly outer membrane protein LptD (OstA)
VPAWAEIESRGAVHWSGDKTFYDTRNNKMELTGHAAIHQGGESLFADKIIFERDTKLVHALGNAIYVGKTALLQGSEMHFNLETRTGTIIGGRVSTEQFTLSGERINKLGVGRFQAHRAEYSTCKDCPQSWTLGARDVDLQIDGYAYLSNVTAKVMDAPALWIPYLVVPIKTKRQTGLLIPQFGFTNTGFTFVQPFFWAISRSFDMTFGFGTFGGLGRRLEWEGRYELTKGRAIAKFFHVNDRTFRDYLSNAGFTSNKEGFSSSRWALHVEQTHEFPFDLQEKLRIIDVSDSLYLNKFLGDVPGDGEAYLTSDVSLTHATDKVAAFVSARRYRNLMTPLTEDPRRIDPKTVQVFPQAELSTNDKIFFDGNVVAGLSLGATNFTRSAGFFDRDPFGGVVPDTTPFRAGQDPIREAVRVRANPSLYTTLRPWDTFSLVPRLNYRQYFYDFNGATSSLTRGFLHFGMDFSTQFERIYDRGETSDFPKVKHLIRPLLNYSLIPYRSMPNHAFTDQIEYARKNSFTGYNFDNEDVIPLDSTFNNANYFAPQGHSISYGFTTQLARKRRAGPALTANPGVESEAIIRPTADEATNSQASGEVSPIPKVVTSTYDQPVEWTAGQSFNFRELRSERANQPLSRVYSLLTANFDRAAGYFDYYYIPYQPMNDGTSRHVFSTGAQWFIARAGTNRVLKYERSIGANYFVNRSNPQAPAESVRLYTIFSINDYIMPGASVEYNLAGSRWREANTTLTFQSPSECWKLDLGYFQNVCEKIRPDDSGWCGSFRMNLSLNLTGAGFGSVSDPQAMASGNTTTPAN